jgi:hypothetical protein
VRVLLTGHEGYIGTVLAPLLMRAGHEVVGLDSGLFVDCTYAGDVAAIPSIEKDTRDVARRKPGAYGPPRPTATPSRDAPGNRRRRRSPLEDSPP